MTETTLSGIPLRDSLFTQIKTLLPLLPQQPHLHVLRFEGDPASELYVKIKQRTAEKLGIACTVTVLSATTSQAELNKKLRQLSDDPAVSGILLQLPIPEQLNPLAALQHVDPLKDVDGLTPANQGLSFCGHPQLQPATPLGIMRLLASVNIDVSGMNAVVIGASNLVGGPLSRLLTLADATVTTCHRQTKNISNHTKEADLIVVAAGCPNLLTADMVKKGVIVVDVGINKVRNPSPSKPGIIGDVAADVATKARLVSPVPGGVGPLTVASLMTNVADAVLLQNGRPAHTWQL